MEIRSNQDYYRLNSNDRPEKEKKSHTQQESSEQDDQSDDENSGSDSKDKNQTPPVNSDPIYSQEMIQERITTEDERSFKKRFIQSLQLSLTKPNFLKALNFIDDNDWEVRFELAKLLQAVVLADDKPHIKPFAIQALRKLEDDSESLIRFLVADTSKKLKK